MPCQEFIEAGPSDPALTITPRQPLAPDSHHLIGEPAQASTVTANAVVGEVAPHHRAQMAMLVAERPVAVFPTPGVDPVWWTPFQLRRRCHRCRRVTDPMRRDSGDRWLLWSDLGEHRRSCRASSNRPPRRSGTGFVRLIAMKAADRTARPAPSARS